MAIAVLIALYALLGFLVLPLALKPRLEAALSERLTRQATLARLEFNPFTLRARLIDFALTDREPARFLARFDTMDAEVSVASLWHRAPVLDSLRIVRPQFDLTRREDGTLSIDDIVADGSPEAAHTSPRFSINNIEVIDGGVSLDDRPHGRRIAVSDLGIGIPFLSSLPYDAEIRVTPRFEGAVDGARFALGGNSNSPFADRREATLDWNLDALPLSPYAAYLQLPGGMKLADGVLTSHLTLAFIAEKGTPHTILLSGAIKAERLTFARDDGSTLLSAKVIDVALSKLDWLARSIDVARISIDTPAADVRREPDGSLELARLAATPKSGAEFTASLAPAWSFRIAETHIVGGSLRVADRSVTPTFEAAVSNVVIDGKQLASSGTSGSIAAQCDADDGVHAELQSDVDLAARRASGRVALSGFHLARLYPYYASFLNLDVRRGLLDLAGDFDLAAGEAAPRFSLAKGVMKINDLETAIRGEKDALWHVAHGDADGVTFDLEKRSMTIDRAQLQQGSVRIVREASGAFNFARLVRGADADAPEVAQRGSRSEQPFDVIVRSFALDRIVVDFDDRGPQPPVKLRVSDLRGSVENLGNARGAKSAIDAVARIGAHGRMHVKGAFASDPFSASWAIDASAIDLVPLRPYFAAQTNIIVTSGGMAARGRMVVDASGKGAPRWSYVGDMTIGNFASLDRPTSSELVRWKTLAIKGIDARSEPLAIGIGSVGMDGFYARLILNSDATLNLQQLLKPESTSSASAPRTSAGVTTAELPPVERERELPVSIGRIELSNGEVEYSDLFVKPNYDAHLTQVSGSVSALSPSSPGDVQIAGRVDGTAPVDIRGTVNPFARQLQLDLTGKASDVELPPLTPYSVKYAGYGIQKGKLSLEVHYRVQDRKLAATNKLKLDQLVFGERVESPTATKLPVLLALSLLKDRNGVINLDLPIEGTLDDPKFSVWGVIVQIFVNLIGKAVTAPFALLSSIAGGGGEQLSFVEFLPGRADLSEAAEGKLTTLGKALTDRPGLKIDASGRAIAAVDRDGLKRVALEHALRAQKQKSLAAQGESAPALEAVSIETDEYPKLLAAVYRDTELPDKPRNMIGMAKTIPPAEMEALLLASYRVDDEALAALANHRAQTVKEWLAGKGGVAIERIFIVAPKLTADGISDQGAPTRVDFAIR